MSNKVDATKMKPEKKRELEPKLRFPEFQDAPEWKEMKLLKVCNINPSNEGLPESFIYIDLESVVAGKLIYKKRIHRRDAPSRAQRLLENGDVIYQVVRPYQRNNLFCDFDDENHYVASTGYAQLRSFDVSRFLYQLIHTDSFVNKVIARCTGSNYPAINSSDLAEINVAIPKAPEQQKIADCLTSLDELIDAQSQKLDALRAHKKGLLQQLFPAEGETLPQLRFPEFRDAGEWTVDELGRVSFFVNERIPLGQLTLANYVSTENILPEYGGKITASKLPPSGSVAQFRPNDILISNIRPYLKKIWFSNQNGGASNDVVVIRAKEKINDLYLSFVLKNDAFIEYVMRGAKGVKMPRGDISLMKKYSVAYPSKPEQQKIANCLTSIDEQITAQSQKIEALKVHKKGLLQQLFPSPEAVQR